MLGQLIQEIKSFLQKLFPSLLSLIIINTSFCLHIILFLLLVDSDFQHLIPILKGNEQGLSICQQIEIYFDFSDETNIVLIPQIRYFTEDLTIIKSTMCSEGL